MRKNANSYTIKLTPETLTVRFLKNHASVAAKKVTRIELEKYVAQTLHVVAGNYVSLHLDEWVDRKPLMRAFGAYHYALWKMAVTFPPELFDQGFGVEVYPGEESFRLPAWLLWLVSAFSHWDDVFRYRCYQNKDFRPHFSRYLRLAARKKVFQGFYTLLSGGLLKYHSGSWRLNQLQDVWEQFQIVMSKEEEMPIPDYPRIVGFAGLLLPFAERVEMSNQNEKEKKRALGKLLEEVDRPIQYAYTASRESGYRDFIFCQRPSNRYFFEKAMQMLEWAGENVQKLKSEGEQIVQEREAFTWARDAEQKVFIGVDQIARVTCALVKEGESPPYQNEADWRAFAYQVKLALWSMFPQYLSSEK